MVSHSIKVNYIQSELYPKWKTLLTLLQRNDKRRLTFGVRSSVGWALDSHAIDSEFDPRYDH